MRPMFGAYGKAGSSNSIAFVSKVRLTTNFSNKFRMMSNVQYYHLQSRKSVNFYFSSQQDIYSPLHLVLVY
jgi:urease alpha subunit